LDALSTIPLGKLLSVFCVTVLLAESESEIAPVFSFIVFWDELSK
jgi:hypothetical protein